MFLNTQSKNKINKKIFLSIFCLFFLVNIFNSTDISHAAPATDSTYEDTVKYPRIDLVVNASLTADKEKLFITGLKNHKCLDSGYNVNTNNLTNTSLNAINSFRKINGISQEQNVGIYTWEALMLKAGDKTKSGDTVVDCGVQSDNNSGGSVGGASQSYNNISSFSGDATSTNFTNTDTGGLGDAFNYILTLMAVVIIILVIFKIIQGAVIKGTFDNVMDQQKGKKLIETAGKALLIFILAYAVLSFINPDLTGWTFIQNVTGLGSSSGSGGGSGGPSGGMCGTFVNSNQRYCQDQDSVLPFKDSSVRGLSNNNPGNIRHAKNNWYGICLTQTDPSFVQFKNPESGIRAMAKLLIGYQKDDGLKTISAMINKWAPGSDNNDPASYASTVSKVVGVSKDATLPILSEDLTENGTLYKIISGITTVENGNKNAYDKATILKALQLLSTNSDGGATCSSSIQTNNNQQSLAGQPNQDRLKNIQDLGTQSMSTPCPNGLETIEVTTQYRVNGLNRPKIRLCRLTSIKGDLLSGPSEGKGALVNSLVAKKFQDMGASYHNSTGKYLTANSSTRTADSCSGSGGSGCAAPGSSPHQLGAAIDFNGAGADNGRPGHKPGATCSNPATYSSDIQKWLRENAYKFDIHQIPSESWHFEGIQVSSQNC